VRALRIVIVVGVLAAASFAPAVWAQPALLVKTDYPAVAVEAGRSVTFDLEVITASPRAVDLSVAEIPDGWQATLRGGGFVVGGVFGDPETPPSVELEIRVPPDAESGDHTVLVRGSSGGLTDTLQLTLTVAEQAAGAVTLEAEFPSFRGSATDTFNFRLTLENNTPDETTFTLNAQGPPGWQVSARPTVETRAATVTVEGGGETEVEVDADPPENVTAGEHTVVVAAAGGRGRSAEAELTVEITGNVELELTTSDERLSRDGGAGRTTDIELEIRNRGTSELSDVRFAASPPAGWDVEFEPTTLATVAPGDTGRVTARVTPSGDAVAGDYNISVTATGGNGGADTMELRFTVNTSRFWAFIGIVVIIAVIVGLRTVYQRFGRR